MKLKKKYFILSYLLFCFSFTPVHAQIIDRILAIVDNEIITKLQLEKSLATYKKQIQAANISQAQRQQALEKVENTMLEQMIDRSLARQEALKYQIKVSDQDVDSAIENMRLQNNMSPEQFTMALGSEGLSLKDYKSQIRQEILQSRLINRLVSSKVVITDSDIRQYYDEHIQEYQTPEVYSLRNILVPTKDVADKIHEKLVQGENFAQLAAKYSAYPNADNGGKLGSFPIDSFSPVIRNGIENLEKSTYSKVLKTDQGYQIFLVEDITPAGGKPFDQVEQTIHNILYKKAERAKFTTWIASLKEHAHIEIKNLDSKNIE